MFDTMNRYATTTSIKGPSGWSFCRRDGRRRLSNPDPFWPTTLQTPRDSCDWVRRAAPSRRKLRVAIVGVEESGCCPPNERRTTKDGKLPGKGDRDGTKPCIGFSQVWTCSIDEDNLRLKNSAGWTPAVQRFASQTKLPRHTKNNA